MRFPTTAALAAALTTLLLAALSTAAPARAADEPLRVGFRCDAPPFSYLPGGCTGKAGDRHEAALFRGFVADICNAVFRELRVQVDAVEVDARERLDMLDGKGNAGKIDVLCDPTTVTAGRYGHFWFSQIVFLSGVSYMYLPGGRAPPQQQKGSAADGAADSGTVVPGCYDPAAPDPKKGIEGAADKALIAYVVNTTARQRAREMTRSGVFGVRPNEAKLVECLSHRDAIEAMCRHRLDFYVADRDIMLWYLDSRPFANCDAATSGRFYSFEPYAIAIAGDKPDLALRIQRAFYEIVRRGEAGKALHDNFQGGRVSDLLKGMYRVYRIPQE